MGFPLAQRIQLENKKTEGRVKAVCGTVWYYLDPQSFSIITEHEMNLKRPIFAK